MDANVQRLAAREVYFGTSSWKYEGWKNLLYKRAYTSKKQFNDTCLEEYATYYPAVGVDHTYYDWPKEAVFRRYVEQTPPGFRFVLKATEAITVFRYPKLKRYGKLAGAANATFLNAAALQDNFLAPLEDFRDRLGPIMFEFSQFHQGMIASGREFVERLDKFLSELSRVKGFQFAIELRNSNWLHPEYFRLLLKHKAGHVFNSWTRMPRIGDQLNASADFALPYYVSRLLLRPGTQYEDAVERFSPYDKVIEEQPEGKQDASKLIRHAMGRRVPVYVLVNNRFEGCAPETISAIAKNVLSQSD